MEKITELQEKLKKQNFDLDQVVYKLSVDDILAVLEDKHSDFVQRLTAEELAHLVERVSNAFEIPDWTEYMEVHIDAAMESM